MWLIRAIRILSSTIKLHSQHTNILYYLVILFKRIEYYKLYIIYLLYTYEKRRKIYLFFFNDYDNQY